MRAAASLHHSEQGAVSISADGSEFCIVAAPAPLLDATHRVIGRVTVGLEVVEQAASVPTATDDAPLQVRWHRMHLLDGFKTQFEAPIAFGEGMALKNLSCTLGCKLSVMYLWVISRMFTGDRSAAMWFDGCFWLY
jgi:hypothetical protein